MVGESLENNFIFFHLCLHHSPEQCHPTSHFSQGTIHILRKHIFRFLGPPTPFVRIFSVLKIGGNYHIPALPPTPQEKTSAYVMYEWSSSKQHHNFSTSFSILVTIQLLQFFSLF